MLHSPPELSTAAGVTAAGADAVADVPALGVNVDADADAVPRERKEETVCRTAAGAR